MGLWFQQVHNALGRGKWVRAAYHAEYVSNHFVVLMRDYLLPLWEEVSRVDCQVLGAQVVGDLIP